MSLVIFHSWGFDKLESANQYQAHGYLGLLKNKPQINADERRFIKSDEEISFLNRNSIINSNIFDETIIGLKLCLLINFSKPRVEIKRIVRGIGNK